MFWDGSIGSLMVEPTPAERRRWEDLLGQYDEYGPYWVALVAAPAWLYLSLHDSGWIMPGLLARLGRWAPEEVQVVCEDLAHTPERYNYLRDHPEVLRTLISRAEAAHQRQLESDSRHGYELDLIAVRTRRGATKTSADVPADGAMTRCRKWRTKRGKALALAANPNERKDHEEKIRAQWVKELVKDLRLCGLPAVLAAEEAMDPDAHLRRCARGRRPATIRARVHEWRRASSWLKRAKGVPWPLDYLEARAAEPCGVSCLDSILAAFGFYESAGEVPERDRLTRNPTVVNAVLDLRAEIARGRPAARRKAPLIPLALIVSLELVVCDARWPRYKRGYAWFWLVRCWAAMRFDDTRGWVPSNSQLGHLGLRIWLERTKTTGCDKRVQVLEAWVASDAYVARPDWLTQGFSLWREMGHERDYFLAMPDDTLQGVRAQQALYPDATSLTAALLADLMRPVRRITQCVTHWEATDTPLFCVGFHPFWTEHAPRNWLLSWAAATGVPKERRDMLGRWSARGSDEYLRTCAATARRIQGNVAAALRDESGIADIVGEGDMLEAVRARLRERGTSVQLQDERIKRLRLLRDMQPGYEQTNALAIALQPAEGAERPTHEDSGSDEMDDRPVHGDYVVSIVGASSTRRLHQVGRCPLIPGIDYSRFEGYGTTAPSFNNYHAVCRRCWRGSDGAPSGSRVVDSDSSVDTSDESSSESAEVPALAAA